MENQILETTKTPIVLTTGIYDLLKLQIKKKKLNKSNEDRLEKELKNTLMKTKFNLFSQVNSIRMIKWVKKCLTTFFNFQENLTTL